MPREDAGDEVPDTNSVEDSMPVTELLEVPPPSEMPDVPSVPRGPNRKLCTLIPIVSGSPLTDLPVLDT